MNKKTSIDVMTETEKCRHVFNAVAEGKDCELTYAELEALQSGGFIVKLKREGGRRWSFEWTDKLREYAIASPGNQKRIVRDTLNS
jgi:hypothetical protein